MWQLWVLDSIPLRTKGQNTYIGFLISDNVCLYDLLKIERLLLFWHNTSIEIIFEESDRYGQKLNDK